MLIKVLDFFFTHRLKPDFFKQRIEGQIFFLIVKSPSPQLQQQQSRSDGLSVSLQLQSSTCSIQCLNQRHPGPTYYVYIPPTPCTCWKYMWTDDYALAYRKRQAKNHAILGIVPHCLCTLYLVYQGLLQYCLLLRLFQKLSSEGWAAGTFMSCGGRVFCWQCVRGVGDLSDHLVQWVGGD